MASPSHAWRGERARRSTGPTSATDYVAVRDAATLDPPGEHTGDLVVLGAAWLGRARLIDNGRV